MRTRRLSSYKQDSFTEHFVSGSTAQTTASLCGMNRKTGAFYFHRPRKIITCGLEAKSYLGGRQKRKCGHGATDKVPVFGLLKRVGKVYTKIIPDTSGATLFPIIKR